MAKAEPPTASGGVLVAGAINTDLVARVGAAPEAGETVIGTDFAIFGGGKAANQAVSAARSGAPTAILGALGNDDFGRQRLADLEREGIDTEAVSQIADLPSGVALILVEEATGQNRIANVLGATTTVTPEQATAALERIRPRVLLLTLELPVATLTLLVEAARAHDVTVVLNATPAAVTGRDLLALADLLIVNEAEAGDLLGRAVDADGGAEAAMALTGLGPSSVVITLGAAGAAVVSQGETTVLPAPRVDVVDTTGAGDAFCGALAAQLVAGADPVEAARVGVIAGSLAATKAGAQPSLPTHEEITRFSGNR